MQCSCVAVLDNSMNSPFRNACKQRKQFSLCEPNWIWLSGSSSLPTDGVSWTHVVPLSYIIFLTSKWKVFQMKSNVNVLMNMRTIYIFFFIPCWCVCGMKFMELRSCWRSQGLVQWHISAQDGTCRYTHVHSYKH